MSISPRKVEESVRWKISEAFRSALEGISKANGYNTSPLVTRDRKVAQSAAEHFVLLVEEGAEAQENTHLMEIEILIGGVVEPNGMDPLKARNMLLQDVRTRIMGDRNDLASGIGRGISITLGRSETDQGMFLDKGWTAFEQAFTVKYPQGNIW